MLSAALGLALLASQPREVVETRCLDTWVDRNHPDANYGHDFALAVGPGAGALVRFPLVDQAVPARSKVVDARLELTLVDKSKPSSVNVAVMSQDWGEGGGLGRDDAPGQTPPKGWATWKAARRGSTGWNLGIDSPHPTAKGVEARIEGDKLVVTGLGPLVREWIENPIENHGLLLTCPENAVLGSSEGPAGPRLVVVTEPDPTPAPDLAILSVTAAEGGWAVTVANLGDAPSSMAKVEFAGAQSGAVDLSGIEPGQRSVVNLPTRGAVRVRVATRSDADYSNNTVEVSPEDRVAKLGGTPAELVAWQTTAREMNTWCLPRSRSSAFPDGSSVRVRVEPGADAPLPNESERVRALLAAVTGFNPSVLNPSVTRAGRGWALDTRDDTFWVNGLPLPPEGVTSNNAVQLPDPRLLGSADLYALANPTTVSGPPALLLRVKDAAGDPVAEPELHVMTPDGKELGTAKGNASGSVPLPGSKGLMPDLTHPWLEFRLSKGGEVASTTLSVWDMWREASRTGKGVATIELRLPLPSVAIDRAHDLAFKRIVADQAKRKPGALDAVVDEDNDTALALDSDAGQGWVEIDLSRDQPVAEVQLVFRGDVPEVWTVSTTETGTEEQVSWVREEFGHAQAAKWGSKSGDLTTVKVRARVRRARTVRFGLGLHQKASLVGIRVFGPAG